MAKKGVKLGITYIIALIATFLIFGFVGAVYVQMLTGDDAPADDSPSAAKTSGEYTPAVTDERTVAAIVDLGATENSVCFMLIRFLPDNSEAVFLPLPADMYCGEDGNGNERNLYQVYRDGSAAGVKTAVLDTLGVSTDRYIIFDADGFGKFCDIFGSTTYNIPQNMELTDGTILQVGETYLDRDTMRTLLTYPGYSKGEEERARRFCEIMTSMLNKELRSTFAPFLDGAFADIVNSGADTDISRPDYEESRSAIEYTVMHTDRFCRQILSSGSVSEQGNFIVDASFITALQTWFNLNTETAVS